jgi:ribonuclease-3
MAASREAKLRALIRKAGARDLEIAALDAAFIHESAVRDGIARVSNERLEFVGDAIVGFVTARWLYEHHPSEPEGSLALRKSALVSDAALATTADRLGFGELMIFGAGTSRLPPPRLRSSLAGAFEAFVAALYTQGGFDVARAFVERQHLRDLDLAAVPQADPKTALQEYTQAHFATMPRYTEEFEGPAHERVFHARVAVNGEFMGEGSGPTKRAAQRAAARTALERLTAAETPAAKVPPAAKRRGGKRS